jgi:cytochrome d ubiquinol oxidase subunit II
MPTLWFCIVAVMLAAYVVLDGFDIGAGAIHLFAAHRSERKQGDRAIGPVWDGNEVWLLATGGVLYFVFPAALCFQLQRLLPAADDGALAAHAARHRHRVPLPHRAGCLEAFFDGIFALRPVLLLAIFYGAALGNVVRGVPLGPDHYFFLPLFTNWRVGPEPGILDWYTVLSGRAGAGGAGEPRSPLRRRQDRGDLNQRARCASRVLSPTLGVLTILSLVATLTIHPELMSNYSKVPVGYILPLAVFLSVAAMIAYGKRAHDKGAFLASSAYLTFMLVGLVFAVYPVVLPSIDPQYSLTIANSVTSAYAMKVALTWWVFGIALALAYFVYIYRMFKGKVQVGGDGGHGY